MSLNTVNTTLSIKNINNNYSKHTPPTELSSESKSEEKFNGRSLLLGSLAALAIGGGIYIANRGRRTKQSAKLEKNLEDMTIDAFKKAGNTFKKGRALLANGQRFVGKLTQKTKKGSTLIFEYDEFGGHVVTKLENGKVISKKSYYYLSDKLEFVRDATKATDDPEGKLVSIANDSIFNTKNTITMDRKNRLMNIANKDDKSVSHYKYDASDKKYKLEYDETLGSYTIYRADGKTKRFAIKDDVILYNNAGEETASYTLDSEEGKKFLNIFKQITAKYNSYY